MAEVPAPIPPRRLSARGWVIFIVAGLAVIIAAYVGVSGLLRSPIVSTTNGVTTISGTWEPYTCTAMECQGYITAGGTSVFVVFPKGCPEPTRGATISVDGRQDTTLGSSSYRANACA